MREITAPGISKYATAGSLTLILLVSNACYGRPAVPVIAPNRPFVAVLPFNKSETFSSSWYWNASVGSSLGAMMTTELKEMGFQVVNRNRLSEVMSEQALGRSGLVDKNSAHSIGKLIGARYLLMGTVSEFGISNSNVGFGGIGLNKSEARVRIDVELDDEQTGETLFSTSGLGRESNLGLSVEGIPNWLSHVNWSKDDWWSSALGKSARKSCQDSAKKLVKTYNSLPEFTGADPNATPGGSVGGGPVLEAKVVDVDKDGAIIDKGSADGVKAGDRFQILEVVKEVKNDAGDVIYRKTSEICTAEVNDSTEHGTSLKLTGFTGDIETLKASTLLARRVPAVQKPM